MQTRKKTVHLICNAHLDPVWLWEWEEGAAEAISTFRTAAELCEKDKNFIFCHNEVTLYKWVQEYEPSLFKRIQKLVKQGRWQIMGGWYLQPDCNMPSGESFVRQILQGKLYFKKYFGVEPTTAINFDPFGHTQGLVQIMAKSGFDSYLFGRPGQEDLPLPLSEFVWVGYDGSELLATRFKGWYNTQLGQARKDLEKRLDQNFQQELLALLWGVGNHGGGPSKKDLKDVNAMIRDWRTHDIQHSHPEAYFKELKKYREVLPRVNRDLNPWGVGCYTSMVRVKQKHRLLENELYMAEKMVTAAATQGLMAYPRQELEEATHDLMVSEFHDILPGSSIQPVEDTSLRIMEHGLEILSRVKARAFFALSSGQKRAPEGTIPLMVYNPHPFRIRQVVDCEFHRAEMGTPDTFALVDVWRDGRKIPSQVEREASNLPIDWRKRIVFTADLKPGQMNRFDVTLTPFQKKPLIKLKPKNGVIRFHSRELDVVINTRTGLMDRYRVNGVDVIKERAFEPLVMMDNSDPWGMGINSFRKVDGRFKLISKRQAATFTDYVVPGLEPVRVIEDGPVRSIVEAGFYYNHSFLWIRYSLPKEGTEIGVEVRVNWQEKDRMIKLSIPTRSEDGDFLGQVAYGVGALPKEGNETVAQKWAAVVCPKHKVALTCINNGTYGLDYSTDGLRLTLLRSPVYSCHPYEHYELLLKEDRNLPRQEQGERVFNFWVNAGPTRQRLAAIDREALAKNEKPMALSFFPNGAGKQPKPLAILSDEVVQLTTIKQAESNSDVIIRLFEPTGKARITLLILPALKKKIKLSFGPFEIKTLRITGKGKITETNLLERPMKK